MSSNHVLGVGNDANLLGSHMAGCGSALEFALTFPAPSTTAVELYLKLASSTAGVVLSGKAGTAGFELSGIAGTAGFVLTGTVSNWNVAGVTAGLENSVVGVRKCAGKRFKNREMVGTSADDHLAACTAALVGIMPL